MQSMNGSDLPHFICIQSHAYARGFSNLTELVCQQWWEDASDERNGGDWDVELPYLNARNNL